MITFRPLSLEDMEQIRLWRNEVPETLRTPFVLTAEQQQQYYKDVICDRRSTTRYWAFISPRPGSTPAFNAYSSELIGYGGLENIQWENRLAEISILIAPEYRGKGYGRDAVAEILRRGFCELNLENIFGECYICSTAVKFWTLLAAQFKAETATLPARKFWAGKYYDSLYFTFSRKEVYPDA